MLSIDDLASAIENSIDSERKLGYDEAFELAKHVLNFFGYSNRIIDNVLEPEDRDAFYMLEDAGILTTEREEITLYDSREWRIHYWLFRREKITTLMSKTKRSAPVSAEDDIYKSLDADMWTRRRDEE
ncbi:MAG: hypothetical protein MJZ68_03425 [archaeon]|nr:hypothetical protein [archaeon]